MGWQPIETAPHSTDLLVTMTHSLGGGEWETIQWVDFRLPGQGWCIYRDRIDIPFPPTHWMPLPDAPDTDSEAEQVGMKPEGRNAPNPIPTGEGTP